MFNVALCVLTHRRMLFRVIKPPLKLEVCQGEGRRPLRLCRCLWCSRVTRTHNALFCQSRPASRGSLSLRRLARLKLEC
jgi:hypothetical protein